MYAEYDQLVPVLLAFHSENGLATDIDPMMAEDYCNLYKDRHGVKPRGASYAMMKAFMANIPPLEDEEEDEEGDRFDPDITEWEMNPSDLSDSELAHLLDFEEVYGVSAMGQAAKFLNMSEW